jgi:FSR family fosmidomycin resistance protein-like MFS transporter
MGMSKKTTFAILFAISLVHLLNDSIQAVIPAIFPILKSSMTLTYFQVGLIGFFLNVTASIMQPFVGLYSDRNPSPYLLPIGMTSTFLGVMGLALAPQYAWVLVSVVFIGLGSAVFHPEAAKVTYLAAGPRRGLAQSIYQVGGNAGQSLAPLITILVFVPFGQKGALLFTLVAALAIVIQLNIARWYTVALTKSGLRSRENKATISETDPTPGLKKKIAVAMFVLVLFTFARSWYHAGISGFYPFYLIEHFGMTIKHAQYFTFAFLAAGAVGTLAGGSISDRIGKKNTMVLSLLLSTPLTISLPYVSTQVAFICLIIIGFIILSSFSVVVVYGQELLPGKVGMVSGLIIGLAFGLGAIGSASLGALSDVFGVDRIMMLTGYLPLLGLLALIWLPSDRKVREWHNKS